MSLRAFHFSPCEVDRREPLSSSEAVLGVFLVASPAIGLTLVALLV